MRMRSIALVAFLLGTLCGAARAEDRLEVVYDAATGLVRLDVEADVMPVLHALREKTGLGLVAATGLTGRVKLAREGLRPAEAARLAAAAAGLYAEESGALVLVRKARPEDREAIVRIGTGFLVPQRLAYEVHVLGKGQETAIEALSRFEVTPGVALIVAKDISERVARELSTEHGIFRRILEEAHSDIPLPRAVAAEQIRVYVSASEGAYFAQHLWTDTGDRFLHAVFVLDSSGEEKRIHAVYLFATTLGPRVEPTGVIPPAKAPSPGTPQEPGSKEPGRAAK